jgi:L-alanine-DL-glutamate epimerase-like enolase superfamily enzyme
MKLHWEPITLDLKTTFRVAHGASDQRHNVLVYLDGGVGEAAAVPYYGETQAGIIEYLQSVPDLGNDLFDMDAVLAKRPAGSRAARSDIDEAMHDLWGKHLGQPLYKLFGLNPHNLPLTSFTIGMDEPEVMAEQAKASGHPILKVKLGSEKDEVIIAAIRKATNAKLRADANAGWSREQALQIIPRLIDYDLEFIEQPLAVDDVEGFFWLKERLRAQRVNIPIFADETAKNSHDIAKLV